VLSSSCEDEDIKESHEGTDVRELDDCYNGGFGKNDRRETACWPWCLGVMSRFGITQGPDEPDNGQGRFIKSEESVVEVGNSAGLFWEKKLSAASRLSLEVG